MLFETAEQAARAVQARIGLGGLAAGDTRGVRNWHVYWCWDHHDRGLLRHGLCGDCPAGHTGARRTPGRS